MNTKKYFNNLNKRSKILGLIKGSIEYIFNVKNIKIIGLERCIIDNKGKIIRGDFFKKVHTDLRGNKIDIRGVIIKLEIEGRNNEILFLYDNINFDFEKEFYRVISPKFVKTLDKHKQLKLREVIGKIKNIEKIYRSNKGIEYTEIDLVVHKKLEKLHNIMDIN